MPRSLGTARAAPVSPGRVSRRQPPARPPGAGAAAAAAPAAVSRGRFAPPGPRRVRRAARRTSPRPPRPPPSSVGGRPQARRQSATVSPVVRVPPSSTSTASCLGPDQAGVERRRDGQRVVDEGAVEAVVAGVELHVEAQRVGDVADDRVAVGDAARRTSLRGSSPGAQPARRARPRRGPGRSFARSVTSRPEGQGRVPPARPPGRRSTIAGSPKAREARPSPPRGRPWMFHSVVGAVLPGER